MEHMEQRNKNRQEKRVRPGKTNSPLSMYDMRVPISSKLDDDTTVAISKEDVLNYCFDNCKRWIFYLEESPDTNLKQYVCKISLYSKKRIQTMAKFTKHILPNARVYPIQRSFEEKGRDFYHITSMGIVDGPWSDKTETDMRKMPEWIKSDPIWRPWQQFVIDSMSSKPEKINIIVDPAGNNGKKFMSHWLSARKLSSFVPQNVNNTRALTKFISNKLSSTYFIELPTFRTAKFEHNYLSVLDNIRDGYILLNGTDPLYFEPPHIWCYTSTHPSQKVDNVKYWSIINDHLVEYQEEQ